jgi:hypothetical protein
MKRYLVILAVLALAACAGDTATRATNALGIACDAHATLLEQVTPLRAAGKISASNVSRVDASIAVVRPVCSKDAVVDPATAINIVNSGIELLKSVKESI